MVVLVRKSITDDCCYYSYNLNTAATVLPPPLLPTTDGSRRHLPYTCSHRRRPTGTKTDSGLACLRDLFTDLSSLPLVAVAYDSPFLPVLAGRVDEK
jgi:hypothetical protein